MLPNDWMYVARVSLILLLEFLTGFCIEEKFSSSSIKTLHEILNLADEETVKNNCPKRVMLVHMAVIYVDNMSHFGLSVCF